MKKLLISAATLLISLSLVATVAPPAQADLSGIQNYGEWSNVGQGDRRSAVADDCNCSGAWTGEDGVINGWYVKQMEYLHSNGFSIVWYRMADDGTWKAYWRKRWVDYDGPDEVVIF